VNSTVMALNCAATVLTSAEVFIMTLESLVCDVMCKFEIR